VSKMILLFLLSYSIQVKANNAPEAAIAIFQTINTNGKSMTKDIVIINGNQIIVNGEKLSSSEVLLKSPLIKQIMSIKPNNKINKCNEGSFIHTINFGKTKKLQEQGCLESLRYKEIKDLLKKVKKSAFLQ